MKYIRKCSFQSWAKCVITNGNAIVKQLSKKKNCFLLLNIIFIQHPNAFVNYNSLFVVIPT